MNKIHTDFHRVVNAIFNIMAIAFLLDVVYFWSVLVLFFSDNIYKIQHLLICFATDSVLQAARYYAHRDSYF